MIHIFFPLLVTEEREGAGGPHLSKEEKEAFYEKGLRPTIATLLPQDVPDWPATYEAELFRAKKRSGHMSYQTKVLPQWVLPVLANTLRAKLLQKGVLWAEDCFFIHTIRGTKHGTQHSPDVQSAELALEEYLLDAKIPLRATLTGDWWIDVGLEFHSQTDHCLQWRTSSHFHIVKDALNISDDNASRITSVGSSKYSRDLVSHLLGVSGCRIEPGTRAEGPFEAAYLQMYTTDKAITYNPEGRYHGKAITVEQAMGGKQPPAFIEGLFNVYTSTIVGNPSNARIEVRVPFSQAKSVLLDFDTDTICQSLLAFPPSEWW
jgi:hypothetical protein